MHAKNMGIPDMLIRPLSYTSADAEAALKQITAKDFDADIELVSGERRL